MLPKFSIIIPVYKEKSIINNTIGYIKSLEDINKAEIIIVDGDKKGSTIKHISNDNIIKILSVKERGTQMNIGAEMAKGKTLIFLHADTLLPFNSLQIIDNILSNKKYKAGAFDLGIDSKKIIFRIIGFISSIRSRITRIPYGDQAYFINRNYFFEIGKFKSMPIMEDVELMHRIKKRKDKIYIVHDKVKTSSRRWEKEGIICCTLRNWTLIILYYLGFKPEKIIKFYK